MIRFALAIVLAATASACVKSGEVHCEDGRLCAPGYQCDDVHHRCLSADQVAACAGLSQGDACSFGGAPGACHEGACEPLICGDGVRTLGEACDGNDLGVDENGAPITCLSAGYYEPDGLACTAFCTYDVSGCSGFCGDGVINGNELCDGAAPPGSCVDFGFDAGAIRCGAHTCGASFDACARIGWKPEPTTLSFASAMDGTSATDLWVVGGAGSAVAVAHYDGSSWKQEVLPTDRPARSIAVAGPGDVWVVVDQSTSTPSPAIVHRTAGGWSVVTDVPSGDYTSVWAASPSAVFVGTNDVGVLAFDGASWHTLGSIGVPVVALDGSTTTDLWALDDTGHVYRWTNSWQALPGDVRAHSIDVIAPGNVWVTGESISTAGAAASAHFDGSAWTTTVDATVAGNNSGFAVVGTSANDVWVADILGDVRHFDGIRWSPGNSIVLNNAYSVVALRQFGSEVVGLSFDGFVYRYNGQMYARFSTASFNGMVAAYSSSPNATVLIDSRSAAYHFDGRSWTRKVIDAGVPQPDTLLAIDGTGPSDIWVSGISGRVYHYDGTNWSTLTTLAVSTRQLVARTPTDVWFIGPSITHYDGTTFTALPQLPPGTPAYATLLKTGPLSLWLAMRLTGVAGVDLYKWNGAGWDSEGHLAHDVTALVEVAPDRLFAVADNTHILYFDGATWTDAAQTILDPLMGIAASAPDDVFAYSKSELLHYDGAEWTHVRPPSDSQTILHPLTNIFVTPDRVDLVYAASTPAQVVPFRRMIRTRFWNCRATETGCSDGVDDDCDGTVDNLDADCP